MGLFLTCLTMALAFFSPAELVPSLAPLHLQLFIMLAGVAASVATFAMRPVRGLQAPQYVLVLGLWGAIMASLLVQLKIRGAVEALIVTGPLIVMYFLVSVNAFTLGRLKLVAGVIVACAVLMGTQAILAYYTDYLGDTLLLIPRDSPIFALGNRVRGFGFLSDPNDFAQFLLIALALLGMFWVRSAGARNWLLLGPPALILVYATYLTFSRGGLLGLGTVFFFAIYRPGRRLAAVVGSGFLLLLLSVLKFTGGREIAIDNTTAGRLIAWGAGLSATVRHPVLGLGFGHFQDVNDLTAHNSFVLCFTELGLFGYFFWMALWVTTLTALSALTAAPLKTAEDVSHAGSVYSVRTALAAFIVTGWFLSRTYTVTLYALLPIAANLIQLRAYALPEGLLRFSRWAPRTVAWAFLTILMIWVTVIARLM
jgi:putative inorganic carbon (hco3(-)) transporter